MNALGRPNRLQYQRERSRLTQKEVALLAGIDQTTYSKHESGARAISPEMVKRYCEVFKTSSYELFFSPEELAMEEPETANV